MNHIDKHTQSTPRIMTIEDINSWLSNVSENNEYLALFDFIRPILHKWITDSYEVFHLEFTDECVYIDLYMPGHNYTKIMRYTVTFVSGRGMITHHSDSSIKTINAFNRNQNV